MLSALYISHIALIERLELPVSGGFVVLTGETGAGKSILIDSVDLLIGGRADRELIQSGQEKALCEGVFELPEAAWPAFEALGIEPEEGRVILSRELSASGKNLCRVNGRLAALSLLKSAGALLVDIHGQHGNQELLDPEKHLEFLDAFAGNGLAPFLEETSALYAKHRAVCAQLKEDFGSEGERERRMDTLRFQLEEIDAAALAAGEEERLAAERRVLANSQEIKETVMESCTCLYGDEEGEVPGAVSLVEEAAERLAPLERLGAPFDGLKKRLTETAYALDDAGMELRALRDSAADDPYRLEEVEARLDLLYRLKKKYGGSVEEVLAYAEKAREELDRIAGSEERRKHALEEQQRLQGELYRACAKLSEARRKAAAVLQEALVKELAELGMPGAQFAFAFEQPPEEGAARMSAKGFDRVQMLFSANRGEPLRPLSKVASGGELSRVMLAIKSVETGMEEKGCLIFDEIDAGIGGRTSAVVGRKMKKLSEKCQVLCVTHSAQIAAMADAHYLISKSEQEGRTVTSVRKLGEEERVEELARMIGGTNGSAAMLHARELLAAREELH